jgi:purine-cytosine permease-like protein
VNSTERDSATDAGRIETHGIGFIPDDERRSHPLNLAYILTGGSITLTIIVLGWLPIAFGLSWWAAFTSVVTGVAVGAAILAPMSLFGPRTGTNNPVSSGAHFGVVGRIIGSLLGLAGALAAVAISVWTGGDALIASAARLFGTPSTTLAHALGYAVITLVVTAIAVYGHSSMLAVQKAMVPLGIIIMIAGVVAFAPNFDSNYAGGELLLGSFWATWVLAAIGPAAAIASYAPFVGDWSRHISAERYTDRQLLLCTGLGAFFGMGIPFLFGTWTATTFAEPTADYVVGFVASSPMWYLPAVLFLGIVAGTAQGTINLYGTGLDLSSILPVLKRVQATLTISLVAVVLVFVGLYNASLIGSLATFFVVLGVFTAPWIIINVIALWNRRGIYYADDLQVFNRGEKGGRYWFSRGYNARALGAWLPASGLGLMFCSTGSFTGPLVETVGGVDISFLIGGALGGVFYVVALVVFPEPLEAYGPEGPRLGARRSPTKPNTRAGQKTTV